MKRALEIEGIGPQLKLPAFPRQHRFHTITSLTAKKQLFWIKSAFTKIIVVMLVIFCNKP